jgi:glycosyltransferase involved in cell wall biosynthesis
MPEPLTVALDGTPLTGPLGGIRRFTDQLVLALREEFPQDNYILLSDQFLPHPEGLDKRWWLYGLNRSLKKHGAQVFHGTDFAVPYLGRRPSVMTVHDLSPWRTPSRENARVRSRASMLLALRIPSVIHTPTEAIRQEVMDRFKWPADRIVAIPLAAAAHFEPVAGVSEPYFLYLGTMEPRKNLEVLKEAIEIVWGQGLKIPLHLAGQARANYTIPAHPAIHYLGPREEGELPKLLSHATAVLYPSTYEGFGLPILEAMQCGATVVVSNIAAHREVAGQAALYANPHDPAQWAQQMIAAMSARRETLSLNQAAKFSWRETAMRMRQTYLSVLS